jgi:hypothetical protein
MNSKRNFTAYFVLVVILAGLFSISCGASSAPTNYSFKDKGYSIMIPGNWKMEDWNEKMTQAWVAPAKELIANVAVTPLEIDKNEPLKNNTPKLLAALLKNNLNSMQANGQKVITSGKTVIGGQAGVFFVTSSKTKDGVEIFETYLVRSGDRLFPIVCSYYIEEKSKVKPVTDQILKSIKFEK